MIKYLKINQIHLHLVDPNQLNITHYLGIFLDYIKM